MSADPFTVNGSSESQDFQPLEGGVHRGQLAALVHQPDNAGLPGRRPNRPDHRRVGHARCARQPGRTAAGPHVHEPAEQPHSRESRPAAGSSSSASERSSPMCMIAKLADEAGPRQACHAGHADRHIGHRPRVGEADEPSCGPMKDHKEVDLAGVTVRVPRWPKQVGVIGIRPLTSSRQRRPAHQRSYNAGRAGEKPFRLKS